MNNKKPSLVQRLLTAVACVALAALAFHCLPNPEGTANAQLTLQNRSTAAMGDWSFTTVAVQPSDPANTNSFKVFDTTATNWFVIGFATNSAVAGILGQTNGIAITQRIGGTNAIGFTTNGMAVTGARTMTFVNGILTGVQ